MDTSKNYVGKVVRVQFISRGEQVSKVGAVYHQVNSGSSVTLGLILTNGEDWTPSFKAEDNVTISSVRLDKGLRAALETTCAAKMNQKAFLENFWKEKGIHERNVKLALDMLKEQSGEMSRTAFMEAVQELFREKYPTTGGFHRKRYFSWDSVSDKDFSVCQTQEMEKYIQPESYAFIYREYDGTLHMDTSVREYKEFCERNAPPIIPELKDKAKTTVSASIGDKNFLLVHRSYEFPLKDGFTKKGVQNMRDILYPSRKPSLSDRIQDANVKSKSKDTGSRTPVKDNLTK